MTFIGPLMMDSNFSYTVYGALDHVHIFSDFLLVLHSNNPSPCNPRSATLRGNYHGLSLGPHFLCICL
jgi:hypothetical protein